VEVAKIGEVFIDEYLGVLGNKEINGCFMGFVCRRPPGVFALS